MIQKKKNFKNTSTKFKINRLIEITKMMPSFWPSWIVFNRRNASIVSFLGPKVSGPDTKDLKKKKKKQLSPLLFVIPLITTSQVFISVILAKF